MATTTTLGQLLIREGLITEDELEGALAAQRERGGRIGERLVARGHLTDAQLMWALAQHLDIPFIPTLDTRPEALDQRALAKLPGDLAHQLGAFPLYLEGDTLTVVMEDPLNALAVKVIERVASVAVKVALTEREELRRALDQVFREHAGAGRRITTSVDGWGLGPEARAEVLADDSGKALLQWIVDRGREMGARELRFYAVEAGGVVYPGIPGDEERRALHLSRPWYAQLMGWLRQLQGGDIRCQLIPGVHGAAARLALEAEAAPVVELSGAVANRLRSGAGSGLLIVAHGDAAVRDAAVAAVARALVDGEAEILASPGAVAPEGAARLRREGEVDDVALLSRALEFAPGALILSEGASWSLAAALRRGRPRCPVILPLAADDGVGALADLMGAGASGGNLAACVAGVFEVEGEVGGAGPRAPLSLRLLAPTPRLAAALIQGDVDGLRWWRRSAGADVRVPGGAASEGAAG